MIYDGFIRRLFQLALTAAAVAQAQPIEVFSEFQRPDPFGGIVLADRGWGSREILSPAVGRGGYTSFHIAVTAPLKESYLLYVVTNPITACRVDLYKEHFVRAGDSWIPDRLTPITRLPDFGVLPDPDDGIEGQTTRVYLLDIWLPPNADVARFRVEIQLKMADWTIRPMEMRVVSARYPELRVGAVPALPTADLPADAAAAAVLADYFTLHPLTGVPPATTVRAVIRRNAIQDMSLAAAQGLITAGPAAIFSRVLEFFSWNSLFRPRPLGPEWYLKIRDRLLAS